MKAKSYLTRIRALDSFIKAKQEQLKEIEEKINSVSGANLRFDMASKLTNDDKILDCIIKLDEQRSSISSYITELIRMKEEAQKLIAQMNNENHKLVLELRYIQHKTFEQIAVDMNYSYQYIRNIHGSALRNFEKILA